ncbi:hypothetical protein L1887_10835 [Cichorium endivia]|nr:hypothetical protein L1887_10835 [Cichorium endivia]
MGGTSNDSSSSSMSPLSSPSSVVYVDLYGKRRQIAKVQVLEREISLLQEEMKSLAELELASRCCKELDEYVEATPDPLIALDIPYLFDFYGEVKEFIIQKIRLVVDPEASGRISGEKSVPCYGVVAVVVVAKRRPVVQMIVAVGVVNRKNIPRTIANVPRFHVTAAVIRHVQNVHFVAVVLVTHAHAFKCMILLIKKKTLIFVTKYTIP